MTMPFSFDSRKEVEPLGFSARTTQIFCTTSSSAEGTSVWETSHLTEPAQLYPPCLDKIRDIVIKRWQQVRGKMEVKSIFY